MCGCFVWICLCVTCMPGACKEIKKKLSSYQNRSFICFRVTMWVWESDRVPLRETTVLLTVRHLSTPVFSIFNSSAFKSIFGGAMRWQWVRAFPSILMTWVQAPGYPWWEKRTVSWTYTLSLKHTHIQLIWTHPHTLNIKTCKCLNFYWEFGRLISILKHCLSFLDNKHLSLQIKEHNINLIL